jgi:hypothetical protein
MKLTNSDHILYLILILILFISVFIKVMCMYVYKCEEPDVVNKYYNN